MYRTNTVPNELRFPKPPFRVEQSLVESPPVEDVIADYLKEIRLWRTRVLQFLAEAGETPSEIPGLTNWSRTKLTHFLASEWNPEARAQAASSVFNLSAFPFTAVEPESKPTIASVMQILQWRSAVADYIDDVFTAWNGPDLEEIEAVTAFVSPPRETSTCPLCLTEFPADKLHPDAHQCALIAYVRAKWPPMPSVFQRWQKQAQAGD